MSNRNPRNVLRDKMKWIESYIYFRTGIFTVVWGDSFSQHNWGQFWDLLNPSVTYCRQFRGASSWLPIVTTPIRGASLSIFCAPDPCRNSRLDQTVMEGINYTYICIHINGSADYRTSLITETNHTINSMHIYCSNSWPLWEPT